MIPPVLNTTIEVNVVNNLTTAEKSLNPVNPSDCTLISTQDFFGWSADNLAKTHKNRFLAHTRHFAQAASAHWMRQNIKSNSWGKEADQPLLDDRETPRSCRLLALSRDVQRPNQDEPQA